MANWRGAILTTKGRALAAKVEAGQCKLALTKFKVGDGQPASLEGLTDLASPKQIITLSSCTPSDTGVCDVEGILTNDAVSAGYYIRELGLFATDPDAGEILYAVSTDPNPDYWQAKGSATALAIAIHMQIAITSVDSVSAKLDPSGLVSVEDLQTHNQAADAHANLLQVTSTANKPASMADRGLWVEIVG